MTRSNKPIGLCKDKRWLLWTSGGFGWWMPYFIKNFIVLTWNRISCNIWGHGDLIQDSRKNPIECIHCCRTPKYYDPKDVLYIWKDERFVD